MTKPQPAGFLSAHKTPREFVYLQHLPPSLSVGAAGTGIASVRARIVGGKKATRAAAVLIAFHDSES